MHEGLGRTFTPAVPDADTLCLAHERAYVESFLNGSISDKEMRRIGLPWSQALVRRTLVGVGSAVLAARLALQLGVAVQCNGGTHHAHPGHGSGERGVWCIGGSWAYGHEGLPFSCHPVAACSHLNPCLPLCSATGWCIFNDQAVAARAAQRDAGVRQCLFVDLDVHQGDGTAAIFAGDPSVFTLSMHCIAQTFPHQLQQSDLDVALPAGTGDEQYMAVRWGRWRGAGAPTVGAVLCGVAQACRAACSSIRCSLNLTAQPASWIPRLTIHPTMLPPALKTNRHCVRCCRRCWNACARSWCCTTLVSMSTLRIPWGCWH